MRLKQYLNESNFLDNKVKEHIQKNCMPFIKEFGKSYMEEHFLWRGLKTKSNENPKVIKPRKDRKPRLINKELHNYLNKIGKKYFGWNIRSEGVFTGSLNVASNYGNVGIFIPSGNYKYVYIEDISDIYGYYDKYGFALQSYKEWKKDRNRDYWTKKEKERDDIDKEVEDDLNYSKDKIIDIYKNQYKTKGLSTVLGWSNDFEAIFQCKEYIIIPYDKQNMLLNIIGEII